ncbi:hypothetical protein [Acidovorax sp. LjRoot117]|uniref:hypothetical protein n=1 Tax=Acidovorax sp. LjRoot117 TaxID=3342255 RepID=UPI003ECE9F34
MLTPERITELHAKWKREPNSGWKDFARAVEAEVRKEDEALIRQMLEALDDGTEHNEQCKTNFWRVPCDCGKRAAIAAASAHLGEKEKPNADK